MLTDAALKALKPQEKMYKVTDRDGMYVRVAPSGALSFRLDYRLNGRRETVYLGKYGRDGISLARARELCLDARRAISEGRSANRSSLPVGSSVQSHRDALAQIGSCGVDDKAVRRIWGNDWRVPEKPLRRDMAP